MEEGSSHSALVTGGARGIGRSIAERLAADGHHVIVFDLDEGSDTVAAIEAEGGSAEYYVGDVRSVDDIEAAVADHRLSVIVNNAAYYAPLAGEDGKQPFQEIDEEEWDAVFDVNVKGAFLAAKAALPRIQKDGSIVNVSSDSVLSGVPGFLHYVASKSALIGLTRGMANELGDRGIRVNAVMPGLTATEATLQAGEEYVDNLVDDQATERRIRPEDIAGVVSFLAGPDSAMVNGEVVVANGGRAFR